MRVILGVFLIPIFLIQCASSATSNSSRVERDLSAYLDNITSMTKNFEKIQLPGNEKEQIKKSLHHLVDLDQYMRNYWNIPFEHNYSVEEKEQFQKQFVKFLNEMDTKNTEKLKTLLKNYAWFTVSEFGKEADTNAWLLVQHADHDISFQRHILSILAGLYLKGETDPAHYAYLVDRVASSPNDTSKRTMQRYGTQGECVAPGLWKPFPVENPEHLDQLRKEMGLEPESAYIERFKNICH